MEAWQHVKLSLTNRSIGLFLLRIRPAQQQARKKIPIPGPHKHPSDASHSILEYPQKTHTASADGPSRRLVDLVVIARGPHPIPSRTRP